MEYLITSPLKIALPRVRTPDRIMYLNMNSYGNTNTFTNNEAKKVYKELMTPILSNIYIDKPVEITYKVYKASNRRLDKMNVVGVISKYLMDALVELRCLEDDNDDFIKTETILPTEVDRHNPRCEVIIKELP
jgi:hypothetical protein